MKDRTFTPEKIIGWLRQAEVELAQGKRVGEVCRGFGISEQSYYRWRSEYGGLKLEQARLHGPGRLRFIFQPTVAVVLGARDGVKDARSGNPPFL